LSVRGVEPANAKDCVFIRVWMKDVPEYEAKGWSLDYAKETTHSDLMGTDYLDCLMVRPCRRTWRDWWALFVGWLIGLLRERFRHTQNTVLTGSRGTMRGNSETNSRTQ